MPLFALNCDWSQEGNNFDFLRFVLASLVIVSHAFPLFGGTMDPWQALGAGYNIGQMCVMAFFVISGLLVTRSAIRSRSVLSYALARVFRLVPGALVCALWMALILGAAFTTLGLIDYYLHGRVWSFIGHNTLLMSIRYDLPGVFEDNIYPRAVNGSLWSLKVEIRMYLAFGLIVFLARIKPNWTLCLKYIFVAVAIFAFVRAMLPVWMPDIGLRPKTDWIFGYYFAVGAAMLCWESRIPRNLALALVLFALAQATVGTALWDPLTRLTLPYLVFCAAFSDIRLLKVTRGRDDISYGIYIYGFPVQQALSALFRDRLGMVSLTVLALAISYLLAWLSRVLVEKPSLERKRDAEELILRTYRRLRPSVAS
ncbi:acyltransferase [Pleomorphomonas sp. JP5]|uniref:acyltransferase family protein n=1 Tax=Pleomorphomonas sp. JP5 TaxID=2942998 RepID=UPI002043E57F|nr:acyltransferase [Pleomorphomonas sp. JP5]MCM5557659.1 acyltransferase [Pleomorphomonas sp. JP5]